MNEGIIKRYPLAMKQNTHASMHARKLIELHRVGDSASSWTAQGSSRWPSLVWVGTTLLCKIPVGVDERATLDRSYYLYTRMCLIGIFFSYKLLRVLTSPVLASLIRLLGAWGHVSNMCPVCDGGSATCQVPSASATDKYSRGGQILTGS